MFSVLISSFVQLAIINFEMNGGIKDSCDGNKQFTCPDNVTFYSSSVVWGVIGPKRIFDGLYPMLKYCFLIGFLLVFPCLAFKWYAPQKYSRYFQPTVIIGGFLNFAPYNLSYYTGG